MSQRGIIAACFLGIGLGFGSSRLWEQKQRELNAGQQIVLTHWAICAQYWHGRSGIADAQHEFQHGRTGLLSIWRGDDVRERIAPGARKGVAITYGHLPIPQPNDADIRKYRDQWREWSDYRTQYDCGAEEYMRDYNVTMLRLLGRSADIWLPRSPEFASDASTTMSPK